MCTGGGRAIGLVVVKPDGCLDRVPSPTHLSGFSLTSFHNALPSVTLIVWSEGRSGAISPYGKQNLPWLGILADDWKEKRGLTGANFDRCYWEC
jgi:hypothetical protein